MNTLILHCKLLLSAYHSGLLGPTAMPEDSHPEFPDQEARLTYFTLPMSLNYQRDGYTLWESALKTFNDKQTNKVFNINSNLKEDNLRPLLLKHKVALQPNKHIHTWNTIKETIKNNWGSITNLLKAADYDFLKLRDIIQVQFKKGFPYLSGPKIFHYWSFIIQEYGKIKLKNSQFIEIAPDTHITKCSIKLGIIKENENLTKEQISERWRNALKGSNITPIDMHPPLWFWSRNNFIYKLSKDL